MSIPKEILEKHPVLDQHAILSGWRGSIAHGMFVPSNDPNSIDDKDTMSVCIPDLDHYFGLKNFGSRGTIEIMDGEWDIVAYELKKFIGLLAKGNPNVMSLLWLDDDMYFKQTVEGEYLIHNRELFNSKQVYHSFVGYSHGQLHRMTHQACQGYMGAKRKNLVQQHGYDTKNAAHLIRLMRMCIEFLQEGKFYVRRHDADELLNIKKGGLSLEEVKAEADKLFKLADKAFQLSALKETVDEEAINQLTVDILFGRFQGHTNKKSQVNGWIRK